MNKQRKSKNSEQTFTFTYEQLESIKRKATNEAVDRAFILMLGLPVMVLHDKFSQLMKREGREALFVDLLLDLYDSFEQGYITLDDVKNTLYEECGIRIER